MMRHSLYSSADGVETTTMTITTTSSSQVVEIDSTTTSSLSTTATTTAEYVTPTIPSPIALESFVSRQEWNAKAPRATVALELPISRIIVAQTGTDECHLKDECVNFVQNLQKVSTHLDDIPYNFLIGSDSKIYEGRGFEHQGQHTSNVDATEYNSIGIGIAFIGNYRNQKISESQENVLREFIEYFKKAGIIHENLTIILQDQLVKTQVPAKGLEESFATWKELRKCE